MFEKHASRFWSKVEICGDDECWPWKGGRDRKSYGVFAIKPKSFRANRMAWMLTHRREIPAGLHVLHSCDNPPCCNPKHLRIGTQRENSLDAVARRRFKRQNMTECKRGHPFTPENTKMRKTSRNCIACTKIRAKARVRNRRKKA